MIEGIEPTRAGSSGEASAWLDAERDAAWTAKLVILRVERLDDIDHFGECLREHERHVQDLADWMLAEGARIDPGVLREPSFATQEPHLIGALADGTAVLAAMEAIETARLVRYPRRGAAACAARCELDRLLAQHRMDAQVRLVWLRRRLRGPRGPALPGNRHSTLATPLSGRG
jgi:hypothetical protein